MRVNTAVGIIESRIGYILGKDFHPAESGRIEIH
ncbi:hypothetical protein J3R74_001508 [Puniceicoccus vermicola]